MTANAVIKSINKKYSILLTEEQYQELISAAKEENRTDYLNFFEEWM